MGWIDENTTETPAYSHPPLKKPVMPPIDTSALADVEKWMFSSDEPESKFVCLIMGKDGTGKSPLALSYLTDEDIKAGKRIVVVDLDGGNMPLIYQYHKERCERLGRKVDDVFIIKNPLTEFIDDGQIRIDYQATFNKIRGMVMITKNKWQEHNIKAIVFDGLSTALKHAEAQMRIEKNVDETGGIQMRFWLIRNKIFIETLEIIKSLPISSFFIAHDDFIAKIGEEQSALKIKTQAMMHQKIVCSKTIDVSSVNFVAKVTKSKYNILKEGKEITFGKVNKEDNTYTWTPEIVFEGLIANE